MLHFSLKKYSLLILTIIIYCTTLSASADKKLYDEILLYEKSNNSVKLEKTSQLFLKKYPKSKYAQNVRLKLAENETDYKKSIYQLKKIIKNTSNLSLKAYCQFRLCNIYYLTSDWKNLERESQYGISKYNNTIFINDFNFFLAKSYFHTQNFDKSYSVLQDIVKVKSSFFFYPEAKIMYNYLTQRIKGNSNTYVQQLVYNNRHFIDTGIEISSLFLLGRHFEYSKNYNLAYSIFKDIVKNYPKSPEAKYSLERINALKRYSPVYDSNYRKKIEKENDTLNIFPEMDIEKSNSKQFYVIEIGPFYNLKKLEKLKKLIEKNFNFVFIVRKQRYFSLYIERAVDSEAALNFKIRLAEEYGLNGNIIFVKDTSGIQYYYGN